MYVGVLPGTEDVVEENTDTAQSKIVDAVYDKGMAG